MRATPTPLAGALVIEPVVFGDERGFFQETFRADVLQELGVRETWVQDNHSRSVKGVLRGMHFSLGDGQAKLVRCARGAIWDVAVDIRPGSPTFGRWNAVTLDDVDHRQIYLPVGFAHGFIVLSDVADVVYRCSAYYDGALERGFAWDDPAVGIAWPEQPTAVSDRDRTAPSLAEIVPDLPPGYGEPAAPSTAAQARR
ncbi:MAG: dTDP-4-dehydrorhamnose 3,5-epimerase [Thermoleophilia bacterium]